MATEKMKGGRLVKEAKGPAGGGKKRGGDSGRVVREADGLEQSRQRSLETLLVADFFRCVSG